MTYITDADNFERRFRIGFDSIYGIHMKLLSLLGFLTDNGEEIVLSERGAYWLHLLQDLFSIEYISKLWGTSAQAPWPENVHILGDPGNVF